MSLVRGLTRSPVRSHVRGLTELVGGASGPSISLSAPDFGGSTYYEGVDDDDITVAISNFEPSTAYTISVSSGGGGTPPANATGTTDANGGASVVMNITGLNAGLLTFTATVASDVKTRNATLAATAAPAAPVISITPGESGSAELTYAWNKPAANGSAITGFVLEVDSGSGFVQIATPGPDDTSYVHSNLIIGKAYTPRIRAINAINPSANSNTPTETAIGTVHVFLLAGQSNMLGRPTYDGLGDYPSNCYDWTGSDYQLASSPLTGADAGDMGLTITFVEDYLAANTDVDAVALVQTAVGGTAIATWTGTGDTNYDNAITEMNQALAAYATHSFEGILWNQGESDSNSPVVSFRDDTITMIGNMRSDITGASSTTPFVLGEIAETNADDGIVNGYLADVVGNVAYTALALNDSLTTFDGTHWDTASLRTYGERYEDAFNAALLNVPAVPEAPARPTFVGGNAEATASWTAPYSVGSAIIDYHIQYRTSPSGTPVDVTDGIDTTTSEVITGLTNGAAYEVRVAAENGLGTGEYSEWSDAATPGDTARATAVAAINTHSGALYEPNDLSTMWQDAAKTTAVTASGDPVRVIECSLGNGPDLVAPSDAARLTLQETGGLYWLDGDGSNWLQEGTTFSLGDQWAHIGGWKANAGGGFFFATSTQFSGGYRELSGEPNTRNTANSAYVPVTGASDLITAPVVITIEQTSATTADGRINGGSALTGVGVYDTSGDNRGIAVFTRQKNSGANQLNGRWYGGTFIPASITSGERNSIETYIAELTGVTL